MYGDRGYTYDEILKNGKSSYLKYVYYPLSKNLWYINSETSFAEKIRLILNYKDLFFGTLNTK